MSVSRWVDDIFFKVSVVSGGQFVRSVDECQTISSEMMHRAVVLYQKEFGIEVEVLMSGGAFASVPSPATAPTRASATTPD